MWPNRCTYSRTDLLHRGYWNIHSQKHISVQIQHPTGGVHADQDNRDPWSISAPQDSGVFTAFRRAWHTADPVVSGPLHVSLLIMKNRLFFFFFRLTVKSTKSQKEGKKITSGYSDWKLFPGYQHNYKWIIEKLIIKTSAHKPRL